MNVKTLFNTVRDTAAKKILTKNFDGRAWWQPIKKSITNHSCDTSMSWDCKKFKPFDNEYTDNKQISYFHYQIHNLSINHDINLRRLIQISLNIGYYESITNSVIDSRTADAYASNTEIEIELYDDLYTYLNISKDTLSHI